MLKSSQNSPISSQGQDLSTQKVSNDKSLESFYSLRNQFTSKNLSLRTKLGLYSTYIVSVLTYASKAWTLSKSDETLLAAFERKLLRRILSSVSMEGQWRSRYNEDGGSTFVLVDRCGPNRKQKKNEIRRVHNNSTLINDFVSPFFLLPFYIHINGNQRPNLHEIARKKLFQLRGKFVFTNLLKINLKFSSLLIDASAQGGPGGKRE